MQAEGNQQIRRLIQGVGMKGELAKTARRVLRETDEYKQRVRWRDGTAANWLQEESDSFAESAYELLFQRVEEFGGIAGGKDQ